MIIANMGTTCDVRITNYKHMKKVALVLGIFLLVIVILIGGLSLYLTDERLRSWVLPEIQEATGRDVQIERISYTLFRTFPRFGLVIENLEVPDPREDKLAGVERLLVSVNLIPLIGGEVSVHRLEVNRPEFTYVIYEDGSTNLDDFLPEEEPDEEPEPAELMELDLSEIIVTDAAFGMTDHQTETSVMLSELDIRSALRFTDVLESTMDVSLGSLDVIFEGQRMVSGLGLTLTQTSVLDIEGEQLQLQDGTLNLAGLGLTLEGNISDWGGGEPLVDLNMESESDDFGALLDLVPPEFEEFIADLDTGGELEVVLSLHGRISEDEVPSFEARAGITDGFIQHTDVPDRISGITLSANAVNDLVVIEAFEATAGETRISASGEIRDPLEESAVFDISGSMSADLSTMDRYVPLEEFDITDLAGLIDISAEASGLVWDPENVQFDVSVSFSDGRIAHAEIPRAVEDIIVELQATHQEVSITRATARSSDNYFSATGTLTSPLDLDAATFEATGDVTWDLATVKEYYPIDEDTLEIRGMISFSGSAGGRLDDPENASFDLDLELADGFISYHELGQPIEELTTRVNVTERNVSVSDAAVRSGSNRFSMNGSVRNYMEENAVFDLTINGFLALNEMDTYYPLEDEFGLVMSGSVDSDVRLRGSIDDLEGIRLDGTVEANDISMDSPDLLLPLADLNGAITFRGEDLTTGGITFLFGESDYHITGDIMNFKALMYEPGEASPTRFTGRFRSEFFDADEFLDFEDVPEDPEPFEAWLPNLEGEMEVEIDVLQFFAMEATDITGTVEMSPDHIGSDNARLAIYGGSMDGSFRWDVFAADHTGFTFNGDLQNMRVEELFSHFDLGGQANLAEHVRADFSATTEFYAEFDEYFEMDMMELFADGDFGMDEARISDHPVQEGLAGLLNSDDLRDLSLDTWTADYHIEDGIMRLDNFNLTSRDLGLNLSGTQDLISDELDYRAEIVMPGEWVERLAGTIPREGREALKRDDGMLVLPLTIRGTSESPRPGVDDSKVREAVEDYLRRRAEDEGRDIIDGVLDRFRRN